MVAMAGFHLLFDIDYFIGPIGLPDLFWIVSPKIIGGSFILVVGISLHLKYESMTPARVLPIFRQGGWVLFWAGMLSLTTWLDPSPGLVVFGILHCIGLLTLLSWPFLRFKKFNFPLGLFLTGLAFYISGRNFDISPFWMWTGFQSLEPVATLDYYPIFRWLGVLLIGISLGDWLYPEGRRKFLIKVPKNPISSLLSLAGKYSLLFYLLHQPILILLVLTWKKLAL